MTNPQPPHRDGSARSVNSLGFETLNGFSDESVFASVFLACHVGRQRHRMVCAAGEQGMLQVDILEKYGIATETELSELEQD